MREVESNLVHCQTDNNVESKRNIKATLVLTCNEELDEYKHNYNMIKISKEEKIIIQSSTNDKNYAKVKKSEAYKSTKCHNNENESDSYSPETNHIVSLVHTNIHNFPNGTKIARGNIIIPIEITLE